jgi:hypothetical protein
MEPQQQPSRTEVRITISVGPEDNILGHDEVWVISHAERLSVQDDLLPGVIMAMRVAKSRLAHEASDAR